MASHTVVLQANPSEASAENQLIKRLHTIERMTVLVLGFVALVFAVLELFGWLPIQDREKRVEIVLAGIGLLLVATTTEAVGRRVDVKNLRESLNADVKNLRESLKREIAQNEERIGILWHAFREVLGDEDFEKTLRGTISHYQRLKLDRDVAMVEKALRDIDAARDTLEHRTYEVFFYGTAEYPEWFYEHALRQIIATNVVQTKDFWSKRLRDRLLRMNEKAVKRTREGLQDSQAEVVRRVFVLDEDWENQEWLETVEVMNQQNRAGVTVRWIYRREGDAIVADISQTLQDFTIFDTPVPNLRYAGQYLLDELRAETRNSRKVRVTSNPVPIEELSKQFGRLWKNAKSLSELPAIQKTA